MFWINEIKKCYTAIVFTFFDNWWNHWNNIDKSPKADKRQVEIVDVTCREGDQSPGTSMNRYEKAVVALWLKQAGIPIIEIGFPANPVDYNNTKFIIEQMWYGKWKDDPIISVLWRANSRDTWKSLEILEWYEKPRIHLFIATSEAHLNEKFKKDERGNFDLEQLEDYVISSMQESLDAALEFKKQNPNLEIEISLEDASNTSKEFFKKFIRHFDRPEVTCINIPDTMWVLTEDWTKSMFQYASNIVEHVELSTHNHNDRWWADSNTLTAIKTWARYAETTLWWAWEWPWNAVTSTIVNNINAWDLYDASGSKMIIDPKVIAQEVGYVSSLFTSIVDFNKTWQLPYIWDLAFEDAAWVHAAAKSVYRAWLDSKQYGHISVEEFFSARGGETQMIEMMSKHWIKIPKNTKDTPSPLANYWMKRCIKTSEREKYVYSRDMLAMYLESTGELSVWPIELDKKKTSFSFTYKWRPYTIEWEWWEEQGFIHGFINWISDFLGADIDFKLIWVDPKNKTPLRQSVSEYLDISERWNELTTEYKAQLMNIVEINEKNHYTEVVRDMVDELLLDWKNVKELDSIIDQAVEWKASNDIEWKFRTGLSQVTWVEVDEGNKIFAAFKAAASEIKKYDAIEYEKSKWWSQLWVCTSEAQINGEKAHSTVSDTNLDHATLISIFRTALPEIIKKIDSDTQWI